MPEEHRDKFMDLHSINTTQYILSLDDLPTLEEFIDKYSKLTTVKGKPSIKRHNAKKVYKFLEKWGLL